MDKYNDDDRNKLADIADYLFNLLDKFDSGSISYMLLSHARDCLLAVDEISML